MRVRIRTMDDHGFSLAELLVELGVMGLLLAALLTIQQQGQMAYLIGANRVAAQQNARVALDRMVGEIRSAKLIVSAPNCAAGTDDVTVTLDVPEGGAWVLRTVRYRVRGTNLERLLDGATAATTNDIVIGGVEGLTIRCYAADGTTATSTASDVRSIVIRLTSTTEDAVAPYSPAHQLATLESRVYLRNVI